MSDSVKKWHEMKEESKNPITKDKPVKYIFLLDFTDEPRHRVLRDVFRTSGTQGGQL